MRGQGSKIEDIVVRTLVRFYLKGFALLSPIFTLYSIYKWLSSEGWVKISFLGLLFQMLWIVGYAGLFIGICGALTVYFLMRLIIDVIKDLTEIEVPLNIATKIAFSAGFILTSVFLLNVLSPGDFAEEPKYDTINCIFVSIGAAIFVASYVFLAKDLVARIRRVAAEEAS